MKKIYLQSIVLTLALSGILFGLYRPMEEKIVTTQELTPEEIWQKQYQKKKAKRKIGYSKANKPDMYSKYFKAITTPIGEENSGYQMNYKTLELRKAQANTPKLKSEVASLNFVQRGPANIGGRTRAIIVDPDDPNKNTWFAGSATGGIWKTTDGSDNWTNLSEDLSNLSVNALAMAPSNHNIIYAGTGESFPGGAGNVGNGIWKSSDRGLNWNQISSTATDKNFAFINRLWVNPVDANIVIVATEKGIFKTTNGGTNWTQVYQSSRGVEDLAAYPKARDTIFAGENSSGILRTIDGGDNWEWYGKGISSGYRYEVAVSPVNRNVVFTSVAISDESSSVYMSRDNAETWAQFNNDANFLGGQGDYDNTIEAHPYADSIVFVGGVDLWKLAFNQTSTEKGSGITAAYKQNADFLSFVNFGGSHLGGGLSTDEGKNVTSSDWSSIEIRFGAGIKQKAHRFTVPDNGTSGVSAEKYTYKDYVDVPFQVWDITNNRQLMISFRDQEKDGAFNLYTRIGSGEAYGELGREYIYINAVEYNADAADENIATSGGGHLHKALYMIWPELTAGANWDAENLPESKLIIEYGTLKIYDGEKTSVADAYGNHGGKNNYDQGAGLGNIKIPGLHPDHHSITIIPLEGENFRIVDGNDGGIGVSEDSGVTFNQKPNNYITTQFYGVAKNPSANEYIGGMQDNGTWQSQAGDDASSGTNYRFRLGGDGFECLWHREDPKKLLGSIYYNAIYRSTNGGSSWSSTNGITEDDGPFITKLTASKWHPDVVFAVGKKGVYKSTDFGANWKIKSINDDNWGGVSSQHNVEVSLADPNIVWAGAIMSNTSTGKIHVSKDEGETYTPVANYEEKDMRAYISGIATHPLEPSTAYLLFSINQSPKILRTPDLGQHWEDISGFGTGTESTNGFPDVVTHCLLVMPHDPKTIWVGTEIGLFESKDNGESWHAVVNGMPPVSIYDMQLIGQQVVFATHGRGVWSIDLPNTGKAPEISDYKEVKDMVINMDLEMKVSYDSLEVYLNGNLNQTIYQPEQSTLTLPLTVEEPGVYSSYVLAYTGQENYQSNVRAVEVKEKTPAVSSLEVLQDYQMHLEANLPVQYDYLEIYLNGELNKTINQPKTGEVNYVVSVVEGGMFNAYVIGYLFDTPFQSNTQTVEMILTDIENLPNQTEKLKLYPNPCKGEFKLQLNNSEQVYTLELFNLNGKKVFLKTDRSTGINTIAIPDLPGGLYLARITIDNKVFTQRILVMN